MKSELFYAEQTSSSSRTSPDRSGLWALSEARETGVRTLETLGQQGEALDCAETVVDSNQYLIDKSGRVLRGMTWWGWVQNKFSSPVAPPEPTKKKTTTTTKTRGAASGGGLERPGERKKRTVSPPPPPAVDDESFREQRAYVAELSRGLEELYVVGASIGDAVEEQNETAPRLQTKLDRLWEATTHVTRQAGRVNEGYGKRATPSLVGHVALREVESRRFLRARGADLALSEEVDVLRATCRFALYEKRAHLLGLQSAVSGRWAGITFAGTIACDAKSFGRWQEFDLDLHHKPTASPILCVAANWGGGCWLRLTNQGNDDAHSLCGKGGKDGIDHHQADEDDEYNDFPGGLSTGNSKRHLTPAEPRAAKDALRRAARFEILFLDDAFHAPTYAEQILVPKKRPTPHSSSPDDIEQAIE